MTYGKKKQTPPENSIWACFATNAKMTGLPAPAINKRTIMINSAGISAWKWSCVSALGILKKVCPVTNHRGSIDVSKWCDLVELASIQHWQFTEIIILCKLSGDNQTKIFKFCRKNKNPSKIILCAKNNFFWASIFCESESKKLEILQF